MPSNPKCYSTFIRDRASLNYGNWCYMRMWGSAKAASDYAKRLQKEWPYLDVKAEKNTGELIYQQNAPQPKTQQGDDQ